MRYYFDTSVWIAYFNENEPYHKEVILWFDKIRKEKHELYISNLVDYEIKDTPYNKNYLHLSRKYCKAIAFTEESKLEAKFYSKRLRFHWADIGHILLAKKNDLTAVTIDIHHWPKIAREFNFEVKFITEIHPR